MKKFLIFVSFILIISNLIFEYNVKRHMTLTRYLLLKNRTLEKHIPIVIIFFFILLTITIIIFLLYKKFDTILIITICLITFQIYKLLSYNFQKFFWNKLILFMLIIIISDIIYSIKLYKNKYTDIQN